MGEFPDRASYPPTSYDVVTIAEVLYYFDLQRLHEAVTWMADAIAGGARIMTVDFIHADRVGFGGDVVHDILAKELRQWHLRGERWPETGNDEKGRAYRMDMFGPS